MFLGTMNCRDMGSLIRNSLMHSFREKQDSHAQVGTMVKKLTSGLDIPHMPKFCTFGARKLGGMYGNGMASNSDLHHIPMHSPI
jgi:hypothetical protein